MGSWCHHRKEFKDTLNKPSKQSQANGGLTKRKGESTVPEWWEWAGEEQLP